MIRRLGLGLALVLLSRAAAAATTMVHPVPLQNTDCTDAPSTASFTAHALFEYRVDAGGAVQGIKLLYADAQPADRKAGFVTGLQACLARWKFRPATVDGVPAATQMMIAFHRTQVPAGGPLVLLPGGKTVSASLITQVRSATLAFTETLLKGRGYVEARGPDWLLRTDLPKGAVDEVKKAIEFSRAAIDQAFPGPPAPSGTEVTLILFKDDEEYQQLSAFDNIIPLRGPVAGQYDQELRLIYSALGEQPVPIFARTMAHEATHHFASLRLSEAHGRTPRWLGEGIAQYVECLKMSKPEKVRLDSLDRGLVSQSTALVGPGGSVSGAWMYHKRAERAMANLETNLAAVDVEAMVNGRLDAHFFDEGALTLYDISWLLVHYLMNGESGRYRDAFRGWVVAPPGERDAATLAAAIGLPAADLKPRLKAYLRQIK